jgi:acetate kinase
MEQGKACVMTINGGSSSSKFALFDADSTLRRILSGSVARIFSIVLSNG